MCWGMGLPSSEKLVNPRGRIRAYLNRLPKTLPNTLMFLILRGKPPETPLPLPNPLPNPPIFSFSQGETP